MKTHTKKVRLHATLIVLAFLAPMLVAGSTAAADNAEVVEPLAVFRPGSPDEPAWTMLKLETRQAGSLIIEESFIAPRCPSVWAFAVLRGTPEDAAAYASLTHHGGSGKDGVELQNAIIRPALVKATVDDGKDYCFKTNFTISLGLPEGISYFLTYSAGVEFEAIATVTATDPDIRILGSSSGDTSFYLDADAFQTDGLHLGIHSSKVNARPIVYAPGGVAGADVSYQRYATYDFEHQPMFLFSTRTEAIGEALIEDPLGRTTHLPLNKGAYSSWSKWTSEFPSGEYTFRVNASMSAGIGAPWHVVGVDVRFPE